MALAIAAVVSCQRNVSPGNPPHPVVPGEPDLTAPMFLSAGSGAVGTRTGGIGARQTQFQSGDIIGVYAAMGKLDATNVVPDWTNIYFANKPATFAGTGVAEDTTAFKWGLGGIGGLANDQFYPAKDRSIFVYAYYPYTKNEADSIKLISSIPTRFVTLVEGNVGDQTTEDTVNRMQPDYMWAVGKSVKPTAAPNTPVDSVRRTLGLDTLTFKHALAQLNFGVYLMDQKATTCTFDSIVLIVPKKGSYDIIKGKTTIIPGTTAADSAAYYITTKSGEQIPAAAASEKPTDALNILDTYPLMVFPMTADELKGCEIEIVVNYGDDRNPDRKRYVLKMKEQGNNLKPLRQGYYNTIYLGVGQTKVDLNCNVTPWIKNGIEDDIIIPVE